MSVLKCRRIREREHKASEIQRQTTAKQKWKIKYVKTDASLTNKSTLQMLHTRKSEMLNQHSNIYKMVLQMDQIVIFVTRN